MSKTVILAEKPSVGRDLARHLGARDRHDGYIEGPNYIVTWSLGHLVGLADPEKYDDSYSKWRLNALPIMPKQMKTVILPGARKQFSAVKKQLLRKDVDRIIIATDAGREGELVARWIIDKAGAKKPTYRLWISAQTDKAIRDGMAHLQPSAKFDPLAASALARAEADWLVGLNITRALTTRFNAQLSAGRVQTPTLAMIVAREDAIARFKSKPYSVITAEGQGVRWEWQGKDGNRLFDADKTTQLLNKLRGQDGRVTDLKQKTRRINPPLLYDLTTLQRDANARIGMSAKDTLRHLQRLYEVHKLVTYPRTDSRYLTDDLAATMPDRLAALKSSAYGDTVRRISQGQAKLPAAFYNPAKVSDHHALLPTEIRPGSAQLNHDEQFIYSLIVERFLGAFLGPAEVRDTSLEADIAGERFTARGEVTVKAGWRSVAQDESALEETDDDTDTAQTLPDLQVGSPLKNLSFKNNERRTRAPHRFSEGTLLAAMENPQAFVDDARANKILKESGGIGTPATRADIIEKLFRNFYITKDGKSLVPTAKGRQVIDLVPEPLRSPLLTAQWEERLAAIAKGQDDAAAFDADMRRFAGDLVRAVKNSDAIFKHDNETNLPCPHCGKLLLAVDSKRGKMRVCPDPTCGYRETVSQTTGARCPQCRHQLVIIHKDDKKLYACNHCGFREPFDRFNDKHKGGKKSSRRDVAAYQKKQAKEKDIGANAFADAWAAALKNKKDQ